MRPKRLDISMNKSHRQKQSHKFPKRVIYDKIKFKKQNILLVNKYDKKN